MIFSSVSLPSSVSRAPHLLDQRFAPQLQLKDANRSHSTPCDAFALQCSLMLAGHDVHLADLAPETLSQVCERLRARQELHLPVL